MTSVYTTTTTAAAAATLLYTLKIPAVVCLKFSLKHGQRLGDKAPISFLQTNT